MFCRAMRDFRRQKIRKATRRSAKTTTPITVPATSPEESFLFDEEGGGVIVVVAATAEAVVDRSAFVVEAANEAKFIGLLEVAEDERGKAVNNNCH